MRRSLRGKVTYPLLVALIFTMVSGVVPQASQDMHVMQQKAKAAAKTDSDQMVIKKIMSGTDCIAAPKAADDVYGWQGDWISLGKNKWQKETDCSILF